MLTVHEVSKLTGVSIRTLQYYDQIGLLPPSEYTQAGYRLYDDAALEILQQILLFRELEFTLKDIKQIIQSPTFDRKKALDQQIELLQLKREHLDNLIVLAREIRAAGGKPNMDFLAFDTKKLDDYAEQAKASWGSTPEYKEFEQKTKGRTQADNMQLNEQMMQIFADIGAVKNEGPTSEKAQSLIKCLRDFITEHFYTCTNQVLSGLGQMYAAGGEITENIDHYGGEGTAAFTSEAIQVFCAK